MGFLVPTEWMTVEIHEITRSDDDHGVNDVTAVFAWDGEDVTLKQHPACQDRTVKTRIASLKIGDRIQVKGVMNVSHFIDPQARHAFRLTLIIDRIRDEGDVDERADEAGDDSPDPEGNERRSRSSKRSRTSTFRTNRQRFRKDRVFTPHVLDRNSRRREDVHRDRGHAEEHGSNGDQAQETRQSKYNGKYVLYCEVNGNKKREQMMYQGKRRGNAKREQKPNEFALFCFHECGQGILL